MHLSLYKKNIEHTFKFYRRKIHIMNYSSDKHKSNNLLFKNQR